MKNLCISLALIGAIAVSAPSAFAGCCPDAAQQTKTPFYYYLNPLPYFGIGENRTNFSLNPFTGFKNCDKCKVKKVKCDECTKVKIQPCPTCKKAFAEPTCNNCDRIYIQPVVPRCTSCGN